MFALHKVLKLKKSTVFLNNKCLVSYTGSALNNLILLPLEYVDQLPYKAY